MAQYFWDGATASDLTDWTERDPGSQWTVALSSSIMDWSPVGTTNAFAGMTYNTVGTSSAGMEIYARVRAGGTSGMPVGVLWLRASSDLQTGYYLSYQAGDARWDIRRIAGGADAQTLEYSPTYFTGTPPTISGGNWYKIRFRVEGTGGSHKLMAKIWNDGDGEPVGWNFDGSDRTTSVELTDGYVGVGNWGYAAPGDFSAIGIGTAGDSAPTEAVGASVVISDAGDETYQSGETGITITGTGFGASQGAGFVKISPTDDIADVSAVTQTVTSWADTSITFTAVKGSLSLDTSLYLFVENDSAESNASGHVVQFWDAGSPIVSYVRPIVFVKDTIIQY